MFEKKSFFLKCFDILEAFKIVLYPNNANANVYILGIFLHLYFKFMLKYLQFYLHLSRFYLKQELTKVVC